MKLILRWFGPGDPVSLAHIRQIPGVTGAATAVRPATPAGIIAQENIDAARQTIEQHGLAYEVVESLDVSEDIKLGLPARDAHIANYQQNIRHYARAGLKVIVYNFRPMFRWARTDTEHPLPDGSFVSAYYRADEGVLDPFRNDVTTSPWHRDNSRFCYENMLTSDLKLDGYYTAESRKLLGELLARYQALGKEGIWQNLTHFLRAVIPVAEECNVKLAIHPDDPPWDLFGVVPRLMTGEAAIDRLLGIVDSPANCLTLCTGTYGARPDNDVVRFAAKYTALGKVPFVHLRNVKIVGENAMEECAHYSRCGSLDMVALTRALYDNGFDGYIRPDHGRRIWNERGSAGNGLYDRALGTQYILGMWDTLSTLAPR